MSEWHIDVDEEFGGDLLRWNDEIIAQVTGEDDINSRAAYAALVECVQNQEYFKIVNREVSLAYDELTLGRFSKPNTIARYVVEAAREAFAENERMLRERVLRLEYAVWMMALEGKTLEEVDADMHARLHEAAGGA